MKTICVTRHEGTVKLLKEMDIRVDEVVSHLDIDVVEDGDIVVGVLPVHIAAKVCEKNAKFYAVSLDLPEELRGIELSYEQVKGLGISIKEFYVSAM